MWNWLRRLMYLLTQSRHDADLREEIEAHRELRAAQLEREGLTSQDAADASRRAIGNVLLAREDARDVWLGSWSTVWQDVRELSQSLARSPSFTIPVVLSLALAIGANVAAFSVVNALVLRPLPVADPDSLFLVTYSDGARTDAGGNYAWYEYMREGARSLSTALVAHRQTLRIAFNGRVEAVRGLEVTGNYFVSLGVIPRLGRFFTVADQRGEAPKPVAVISDRYWASRFGRSPSAIGSSIDVGEVSHQIVGVTPPAFFGLEVGRHADVTVPMDPASYRRGWVSMAIVVRPRAGVSPAAAAQELTTLLRAFAAELPARRSLASQRIELSAIAHGIGTRGTVRDRFARPATMVAVMLGLMLLVASTNWAVLLLARASVRRRDVAIRLALGSSRARVARRVAIEAVLLATTGGAIGLLAASWTVHVVPGAYLPDDLSIHTDARVALFATALSLIITAAVAAAPVWLVRGVQTGELRGSSRIADVREGGVARRLIAVQVALGVVLVAAASFFGATARNLQQQDLGFVPDGVVTFVLDAEGTGLEGDALQAHHRGLLESLRALPNVQTATLASVSPLSGDEDGKAITVPGFTARDADDLMANVSTVGPGYFDTVWNSDPAGARHHRGRRRQSARGGDQRQRRSLLLRRGRSDRPAPRNTRQHDTAPGDCRRGGRRDVRRSTKWRRADVLRPVLAAPGRRRVPVRGAHR